MKVLIISDNHRYLDNFRKVLEREAPFDLLVHAGDAVGTEDELEWILGAPPVIVRGNCDGYSGWAPSEKIFYMERYKTFLTHGHLYDAHRTANRMVAKARTEHCRIAVFGHTHVPGIEWIPDGKSSRWCPDDDRSETRREDYHAPAADPAALPDNGDDTDRAAIPDALAGGLLLMNPGSLEIPKQRGHRPSYITVDIRRDGALDAVIRYL